MSNVDLAFMNRFEGAHLLVAGEVGLDEYIWGDCRRISPEAPVPVIEVESQTTKLGLAANVAQNIVSLGGKTTLITVRGMDPDGDKLAEMIAEAGIPNSVFLADPSRPTLRKVRIIAHKQHVVRVDYEKTHPLDAKLCKQFLESISDLLPNSDGIIVQDYGKGLWNADTMGFVHRAKELKKPVFIDPSRQTDLSLYRGATLLTPNVSEAETLCGFRHEASRIAGRDEERLERLAKTILQRTEAQHAVITCGEWGMVSATKGVNGLSRIPTFAREVYDVTGAGDTAIAVVALMYVTQNSLAQCLQIANAAAGLVVGKIGTACVTGDELAEEIRRLADIGLIRD